MPYTHETRTFTIEVEVTARAHIQTGGSSAHDSDDPPWAEITEVEIDYVDICGERSIGPIGVYAAIMGAAEREFEE